MLSFYHFLSSATSTAPSRTKAFFIARRKYSRRRLPALPLLRGLLLKLDPLTLSVGSAGRLTLLHTCRAHTAGAPHLAFLLQDCLPPPPLPDTCTEVSLTFFKPLHNSHRPRDGFLATPFESWTTFPPLCSFSSAVITI